MKTNRFFLIIILILGLTSCDSYYRMRTTVHPDSSVSKEVYALGDSAFMAGNRKSNPFFFPVDSGWDITRFDSTLTYDFFGKKEKFNVRASRTLTSAHLFTDLMKGIRGDDSMMIPRESLTKHFRWFYTYYTFTAVYPEIKDKGPLPLGDYLSKTEQELWFQGNMAGYRGMNGIELKTELDGIEERFMKWYSRSLYEVSFDVVQHFEAGSENEGYLSRLAAVKDSLYTLNLPKIDQSDSSPEQVCEYLDEYFKTSHFASLYKKYKNEIEKRFDSQTQVINLFGLMLQYQLAMPGQMISSNAAFVDKDTMTWKVDAYRFLAEDYTLTAESRVANVWAFIVTFVFLVVVALGWVRAYRRR